MQKDSEGNGYSPLSGIDFNVIYVPETTWRGEVYSTKHTADDNCMTEDGWAELKVLHAGYAVLYPVN